MHLSKLFRVETIVLTIYVLCVTKDFKENLTFWFNKALASVCTSELNNEVPLMTLLRAARD